MNLPALVIYDDSRGRFGPMTDRRPAFALRTGAVTSRVRIETSLRQMASTLLVPPRLADVQRGRETDAQVNVPLRRDTPITAHAADTQGRWSLVRHAGDGDVLLVNGRWLGYPAVAAQLIRELPVGGVLRQASNDDVIVARLDVDDAQRWVDAAYDDAALPAGPPADRLPQRWLIDRPWHILDQLEATVAHDLPASHTAATADVHPSVVILDAGGPVVIEDRAVVGPFCVLEGPVFIGADTVVQPHTLLRPRTILGPACKVAGEISFSIVHGNTNKAHFGYLGNSLVGEWCNLGAGTTVSNLKNTYGPVRVQLDEATPPEATGRTSQGPILGDFVRTAIGSRILTGSCIGTAAMLATPGFAPKFTPAGVFLTDKDAAPHEPDKLIATVREMMSRRKETLTPADEALLRAIIAG